MTSSSNEVVIIGAGIAGISTAYFLAQSGIRSTIIEKDSVGSHASGFAYGGLSPLSGAGIPGPMAPVALEGFRLHKKLSEELHAQTGVNTEYRERPALALAFTNEEASRLRAATSRQQAHQGFKVNWLDQQQARQIEPRISDEAIGGTYIVGGADVEPYRFSLSLAQAVENLGSEIRHGVVTGLNTSGGKVTGVVTESGEISCDRVVFALGPWSAQISEWIDVPIEIRPLKGQIIRLQAPGAPFTASIGYGPHYATTKPDGLLWAGTTEEEAGFDEQPTPFGRDSVMESLLRMIPSIEDAELVQHTACMRPVSSDGMIVLGAVPGVDGAFISTGGGRKGILYGPAMGRMTADLVTRGSTDIPIDAFDPGRFAK